jgi:hypothetical protein
VALSETYSTDGFAWRRLTSQLYLRFLQGRAAIDLECDPVLTRKEIWLQHNDAPPHFGRQVTAFLNLHLSDHRIGEGGPVGCPTRSPDIWRFYYFLCYHLKSLVYAVKSDRWAELLNRIKDSCAHIRNDHDTVKRAVISITRRAQLQVDNQGGYFESCK